MGERYVYAIASGSYSDYRVHAIVDGKKKDADALVKRANDGDGFGDGYRVESLMVVSPDVKRIESLLIQENIWDDGTTNEYFTHTSVRWPFDLLFEYEGRPVVVRWVRAPIHYGKGGRLEVRGTDHERVRKTFSDMRAALLTDDAMRSRRGFYR